MDCLRATFARVPGSLLSVLLILGAFFAFNPQTQAQNVVYATTNTAAFGTLDLDSGAFTQRGTSQQQLAGLGELGASLYSVVLNGGTFEQVSLVDGSLTALASVPTRYKGFGANTNTLYAISTDGNLCHYILEGGTVVGGCFTPILFGAGTLAMSADGSALYAAYDSGAGSTLYLLDTTLGGATAIGPTGVAGITSLVFRHSTLYAATATGGIYTLNLQNGQATFHASTSVAATGMALPASTFTVLHTFTGNDGATPFAGLIMDRAGALYGTTYNGGTHGDGTVFKLTNHSGGWIFSSLYDFQGSDGANPEAPVTIGPDGALYGTTHDGGQLQNEGVIFRLNPPPAFCRSVDCPFGQQILYLSQRGTTPGDFNYGALIFDTAGNIYGASIEGGTVEKGTVYELSPSGGEWTINTIHSFGVGQDGFSPQSGVIFDNAGNLYGTTYNGGADGAGTVYELSPSGGSWTETRLHDFTGGRTDGDTPIGGLLFDGVNTFYGTTVGGGANDTGTVYSLTNSNGSWIYSLIFSFPGRGSGPYGGLIRDSAGNLYGTTTGGGQDNGNVFELTPSGAGWIYTELYEFTNGADGVIPYGSLLLDSAGNLYGTSSCEFNCHTINGTVYKLTPE